MKRTPIVPILLASLILSVAVTAASAQASCEQLAYSPFDPEDTRLSYNGDAAVDITDGTLDLTPPTTGQSGSVFTTDGVNLASDAAFSTKFSFAFTEAGGGGADGIVFALQTVSSDVGGGGGGIGYEGLAPSVGVEFDSWNNGSGDNFSANHVGINVNGSMSSDPLVEVTQGQLDGGSVFYAWVDYDGATDQLDVRLATTDSRPDDPLISTTIDLADILLATEDTQVFAGFTSGTGGAWARHTILTWEFVNCLANIDGPPTAVDDAYETDEDTPLSVPGSGVLANDVGVGLFVNSTSTETIEGTVDVTIDGAMTYALPASAQALDDGDSMQETFTYEAQNTAGADEATVVITVFGVNDAPTADAGEDPEATEVDQPVSLAGTASDVDEGETLTISWSVDGPCTFSDASSLTPELTCSEVGTWMATLSVDDGDVTVLDAVDVTVVETLPETGTAATTLAITAALFLVAGTSTLRTLGRVNSR